MTGWGKLDLLLDGLVHDLGDLDLSHYGLGSLDVDGGGGGVGQTIGVGVAESSVAKTSVGESSVGENGSGGWKEIIVFILV